MPKIFFKNRSTPYGKLDENTLQESSRFSSKLLILLTLFGLVACCGIYFHEDTLTKTRRDKQQQLDVVKQAWSGTDSDWDDKWVQFKINNGLEYSDEAEDNYRQKIWLEHTNHVLKHNNNTILSYTLKIRSDRSTQEFFVKNKAKPHNQTKTGVFGKFFRHSEMDRFSGESTNNVLSIGRPSENRPKSVDWRDRGIVTPVKNQGECGSCYAFAATGALEAQIKLKDGHLSSLSEQNIVDCSKYDGNYGCDGGWITKAYDYIKFQGGIDSEKSYPYSGLDYQSCDYREENKAGYAIGHVRLTEGSEEELEDAVYRIGPIAVSMFGGSATDLYDTDTYNLFHHHQGIFECESVHENNHAVLVVGYGDACEDALKLEFSDDLEISGDFIDGDRKYDPEEVCRSGQHSKYWIVKNSWGTDWGDDGYIKIARRKNNSCGIATDATYPLVGRWVL